MKKIIFLLLLITSVSYGQAIAPTRVKITNNVISTTAPFIATQETDGFVNKINKFDLIEVIEYVSAVNLPITGVAGKIYVTKDNSKIYRWNGTYYTELAITDISGKVDKIVGKGLSTEDYTTPEKTKLAGLFNYDPTTINNAIALKVDKVAGKSLISDTEITRLSTVVNQDISGKEDIANKQNSLAVDGTNTKYPTVTAVNGGLSLKANLASPALTGTPTAPTPTTTTGIANKNYVDGLNSGNVKLTGAQAIVGVKTFTNDIVLNGGVLSFLGSSSLQTGNPSIYRIGNRLALNVEPGGKNVILDGYAISSSITLNLQNSSGTLALTSNPTSLTATSFIKPSSPTTNILLAGGGDIAQNTAFNKNFGTTAGTVVEGGTLGSNAYTSTAYLPLSGGTVTGNFKLNGLLLSDNFTGVNPQVLNPTATVLYLGNTSLTSVNYEAGTRHEFFIGNSIKGGFDSTGLFVDGTVTATSLPVFENNAAASSLAVGQFYRTSIGVLMVKF